MVSALGSIATQQANPTKNTMENIQQILDNATTHPGAIIANVVRTYEHTNTKTVT